MQSFPTSCLSPSVEESQSRNIVRRNRIQLNGCAVENLTAAGVQAYLTEQVVRAVEEYRNLRRMDIQRVGGRRFRHGDEQQGDRRHAVSQAMGLDIILWFV